MLFHGRARFFFFSHQPDHIRSRPNELDVARLANFREAGIFRQQAITGMDRVHIRDFRRADHRRNVEIALRQLRRPYADRFVRKAHVQRVPVRLAINRHRADAQLLACADHTQSNFAAIRYQNFLEHTVRILSRQLSAFRKFQRRADLRFSWDLSAEKLRIYLPGRTANSSCPYSMSWPLATSFLTNSPATSHSISFINFCGSPTHSTWPTSSLSPAFTKGGDPGEGDS